MSHNSKAENIAFVSIGLVECRIREKDLGSNISESTAFAIVVSFHLAVGVECQSEIDEGGLMLSL